MSAVTGGPERMPYGRAPKEPASEGGDAPLAAVLAAVLAALEEGTPPRTPRPTGPAAWKRAALLELMNPVTRHI